MATLDATAPVGNPFAAFSRSTSSTASSGNDLQDRFMTLLMSQLKNQDPLNPLDNAQVTSQLAQINTVTGISKTNSALADLATRLDGLQSLQATMMVDKDVLVAGNTLALGDSGARGAFNLAASADSVQVRILDAGGTVVNTQTIANPAAGTTEFKWDGKLANGSKAPAGNYTVEISAKSGGTSKPVDPLVITKVTAVSSGSNGLELMLANGSTTSLGAVRRVY